MRLAAGAAAAFMAAFLCAPVAAAAQCAPTSMLVPALELTGEVVVWRGLSGAHLVLLMMHPQTPHAWTFIATSPRAITCVIAHGSDAELRRDDVRARTSLSDGQGQERNDLQHR